MTLRRRREHLAAVAVSAALAGLLLLHGLWAHAGLRARLDRMLEEHGDAMAETVAAGVRASAATLDALEGELARGLRLKASLLARTPEFGAFPEEFARAAELRHLLVFDASGRVEHSSLAPPPPGADDTLEFDVQRDELTGPAAALVRDVADGVLVREWAPAGRRPFVMAAVRMVDGRRAVLVQDGSVFGVVREVASPSALVARLEQETRTRYVRTGAPPPRSADVLAVSRPVAGAPGRVRTVHVGIDRAPVTAALDVHRRAAVLMGVPFLLFAHLATWLVLRLRRSRVELNERLLREERLSTLGRFAAGIAHEVRNPLNGIGIAAQCLGKSPEPGPELEAIASVIVQETERLSRTVQNVLDYAGPSKPRCSSIDGARLLEAVAELASAEAERRGVRVEVRCDDGLHVWCDSDLVRGAAWNLVRNALQFAPRGSAVEVALGGRRRRVELLVSDRGPGIDKTVRRTLFEPFATTRRGGSGLGLPMALQAARAHGGDLDVEARAGGGTCFRLWLPRGEGTR